MGAISWWRMSSYFAKVLIFVVQRGDRSVTAVYGWVELSVPFDREGFARLATMSHTVQHVKRYV